MSTCTSLESYKGRGQLNMALRASDGSLGPWFAIAEARRLEIQIEQDFEDQYSRCQVASGNIIHNINQSDYNVELDAFDFSTEALAKAYYGTYGDVTGTSVSGETLGFTAVGQTLPLENPFGVSSVASGVLVEDTDYTVDYDHGTITSLTLSGDTDFDYDFVTYEKLEGVVSGLKEYAFRFDGYNINNSNKPVQIYIWRVALNASSILSLISEETNTLTMSGKALADATQGAGESQYFVVKKAK